MRSGIIAKKMGMTRSFHGRRKADPCNRSCKWITCRLLRNALLSQARLYSCSVGRRIDQGQKRIASDARSFCRGKG